MSNETQNIQDQQPSAQFNSIPTSESVVAAANAVDDRYIDNTGYHVGQSWNHDGFAIDAVIFPDTDGLRYVATESDDSQAAHVRQFRYTQTFLTLAAATLAIDSAQDKHDARDAADVAAGRPAAKLSTGYNDAQMSAQGWQRVNVA